MQNIMKFLMVATVVTLLGATTGVSALESETTSMSTSRTTTSTTHGGSDISNSYCADLQLMCENKVTTGDAICSKYREECEHGPDFCERLRSQCHTDAIEDAGTERCRQYRLECTDR